MSEEDTKREIIAGILRVEMQNERSNWQAVPKPPLGKLRKVEDVGSQIATPGIFEVFVVYEHPDGRHLGASISRMYADMEADLIVFDAEIYKGDGGRTWYPHVAYSERKEGSAPTPGTWHY